MKNKANWIAFSLLFIVVGAIWFFNARSFQSEKTEYETNGVQVTGTVRSGEYLKVGKSRTYEVNLQYTTQSNEPVGDVIFADCQLMNGFVFDKIETGKEYDVIYLPESPKENTILALSLQDENIGILDKYLVAYLLFGLGAASMIIAFLIKKKTA